jgi:hypothetical protein
VPIAAVVAVAIVVAAAAVSTIVGVGVVIFAAAAAAAAVVVVTRLVNPTGGVVHVAVAKDACRVVCVGVLGWNVLFL